MIHDGFGIKMKFPKVTIAQLNEVMQIITHLLLLEKKIIQTEYLCNNLRNRFQTNDSFQERDFFFTAGFVFVKEKIASLRVFSVIVAL